MMYLPLVPVLYHLQISVSTFGLLMRIFNNIGSSIDPWDTPLAIGPQHDITTLKSMGNTHCKYQT